jgi:hypothetical protein
MAHGLVARATVDSKSLIGEVTGLDLDGALLLRADDGVTHRVRSGDVEMIRSMPAQAPTLAPAASAP